MAPLSVVIFLIVAIDFKSPRKRHNKSTANSAKKAIFITLVMHRNPSRAPNTA